MTNVLCRVLALPLFAVASVAAAMPDVDAARFLRQQARYPGGVRVTGVQAGGATVALELRRFEVFARDARLVADDGQGHVTTLPRPRTRYYAGHVDGGGSVFLAVEENGRARGIVDRDGAAASIDGDAAHPLRLTAIDTSTPRTDGGFQCGTGDLAQAREIVEQARTTAPPRAAGNLPRPYRARAAIETDYEFFHKFDDVAEATAYVGDVIGYASTKYMAEIDTRLEVSFLRLWTSTNDPWGETTSNCSLYELGRYWNTSMTGVSRTFVHMLSGRATGGGVAWLGALCRSPFNVSIPAGNCNFGSGNLQAGGDYGFTGNLRGNFVAGSPQSLWDSVSPAHEIGHNFNSPHTHCYNGIGGNAEPIDKCYSGEQGCYSGAASLPGASGQGSGTIMSYCHLLSGGFSNITMTFGTGHAYGVAPDREAARMKSYVENLAQSNPACLVDDTIFADGFD